MNLFDLCVYKNLNKESGGDVDVSSLVATENKTYNAGEGKAYNPVVVNVPTPSPSLQSLTASHNGYFVPSSGYDGFSEVTVDVATPLETLSATENGTYTPSSGYEGFSEVTVDVPLPNNAYLLESQKNDVVTIQHGAEFDMPKLIASIEPQQSGSGDPSPTNIRPISGWTACNVVRTGKNLFDINSCESGYINENGVFVPYSGFYCTPYLNIKPNITYSLAYNRINTSSGSGMRIAWYDKNKTFIRRDGSIESGTSGEKIITATAPSNAYYCRCSLVDLQEKYILAIGTITDLSSYTPYDSNSHTYTINFVDGSSPLIIYGGMLDVIKGTSGNKKTLGFVDLGTLNWSTQGNPNTFQAVVSDMLTPSDNIMCSHYPTISASTSGANMPDKSIKTYGNSSAKYIIVKDSTYSDVTTFKTAMDGVQLVYELETPITFESTPTPVKSLRGVNNIYADTGKVDVQIWTKEVTS